MTYLITQLTPEQMALIPEYWAKWQAIALSTQPLDRGLAQSAVNAAYHAIGKPAPEIVFCESPNAVPATLNHLLKRTLSRETQWLVESYSQEQCLRELHQTFGSPMNRVLDEQLHSYLWKQLNQQLSGQVQLELALSQAQARHYEPQLWEQLALQSQLRSYLPTCLRREPPLFNSMWMDFAISVLNCTHDRAKGTAFLALLQHCGWLFPYEKLCLVCDRPRHLSFDAENRLHAEGLPAIQFADGFSVYAYAGVRLPEQYGRLHPQQWRSHWLLQEPNAELRRVLIQGIGYGRICQELEATELDSWQAYTLLEIDVEEDDEPILLLKMTCPSTGFIHVARVPPDSLSAKEAISWMNWDIDPEEFAVQT